MSRTYRNLRERKLSPGLHAHKRKVQHELTKQARKDAKNFSLEEEESILTPKTPHSVSDALED